MWLSAPLVSFSVSSDSELQTLFCYELAAIFGICDFEEKEKKKLKDHASYAYRVKQRFYHFACIPSTLTQPHRPHLTIKGNYKCNLVMCQEDKNSVMNTELYLCNIEFINWTMYACFYQEFIKTPKKCFCYV